MKRFITIFSVILLLFVFCVPFAFASSGTDTTTETETDTELEVETGDSLIPDTDLEGAVDQQEFLDSLGNYFGAIAVPHEVTKVFNGFLEVWGAVPAVIRYVLILGFALASIMAILKMIF